jgi:hypothetical protein
MRNLIFPVLIILKLLISLCYSSYGQITSHKEPIIIKDEVQLELINKLPTQISEASGLIITHKGDFWTHNDGGLPVLYCLDSMGNLSRTLYLNHRNRGWEEITIDNSGTVYLGGFGNNKNDRQDLKFYIIKNLDSLASTIYTADIINFKYKDQTEYPPPANKRKFDADAFIKYDDFLYIFTKSNIKKPSAFVRIYKIPSYAREYEAEVFDSLYLGNKIFTGNSIGGAALSPDKKIIALVGADCLWLVTGYQGKSFKNVKVHQLPLNHLSNKGGIAFYSNTVLYLVDETINGLQQGALYRLDLSHIISKLGRY